VKSVFETLLPAQADNEVRGTKAGHLKPVTFSHTPPGAVANCIMLPLATLMLILSLRKPAASS